MPMFHETRRAQRGLTLLELMLSIAVGLSLIGLGISMYGSTNSSAKNLQAANDIQALGAGIREAYANSPSYAGITPAVIINMGKAPKNMVSGTSLVSAFNSPINGPYSTTVASGVVNGSFYFEVWGVPREQCVSLVMASHGSYDYVYVGPHNGSGFTSGYHVKHQQVGREPDVATVSTYCNNPINGIQFIGK